MSYLLAALGTWLCFGHAQAATVAVLRSPSDAMPIKEALFRLQGELLAVGLTVTTLERPPVAGMDGDDARHWLERTSSERGIDAFIDVLGDTAPAAVDVWICERAPRRLRRSRVMLDAASEDAAATLAIRAIDVLRSSFLARDFTDGERRPPAATDAAKSAPADSGRDASGVPTPPKRFGVEAGATLLTTVGGPGPALLPLGRVEWAFRSWLALQVTGAGFGTRPEVASGAGSVEVAQQFGVLGLCACELARAGVHPFAALAAGALHTALEGRATAPNVAHHVEQWAFLFDAGAGARLSLSDALYLTLAGHVQLAEPYVAVHVADTLVATTGRPNLLVAFSAGGRL